MGTGMCVYVWEGEGGMFIASRKVMGEWINGGDGCGMELGKSAYSCTGKVCCAEMMCLDIFIRKIGWIGMGAYH